MSDRHGVDVLFLARSLEIGGAERQLTVLARALHEAGWRVAVATYYPGGALEPSLREHGVPVLAIGKRGRWDVVGFATRLAKLVRTVRPRVLHSYLPNANVIGTLARSLVPDTRLVWGVRAADMDLSKYDWLERLLFRTSRMLVQRADALIVNSAAGRAYHVAQGYPADRMTVIPNGIDTDRFRPDAEARARERVRLEVRDSEILVGMVARLDPMKDHETVLRAAAAVARSAPDVRFVCVGDGPPAYAARLRTLADESGLAGRLRWEAGRPDVVGLLNALDVLVSASVTEGFPNVVAEAMAVGVPCVVTDAGDSATIVGELGWIVPPRAPDALARGIEAAVARARAGHRPPDAACRERIVREFGVERMVERTVRVLWPEAT